MNRQQEPKTKMQAFFEKHAVNRSKLAKRLGISRMSLKRYEDGEREAPQELLERMAADLRTTVEELKNGYGTGKAGRPRKSLITSYRQPPKLSEPNPLIAAGPPIELTDRGTLYEVPVYGYVAAGPAVDEALEEIDSMTVVEADAKFKFLRVRGRSMIERGVDDGDDLKVEERPARDGEVVLADLDGRLMLATIRFKNRKPAVLEKAAPGFKDIPIRKGQTLTVRWVVLEIIKRQRPHPKPRSDGR